MKLEQRRRLLRVTLELLAANGALVGLFATVAPHSFYSDVPGVELLPPYNQHLLGDVGGFYLGFGLIFAWAAATLERQLVRAACSAWTLTQLLHFIYHAIHLDHFGVAEAIVQTLLLGLQLALALVALWLTRPLPERR